jgi:hypothetical protein
VAEFKNTPETAAVHCDLYKIKAAGHFRDPEKVEIMFARMRIPPHLGQRKVPRRGDTGEDTAGFDFDKDDGQTVKGNDVQFSAFEPEVPGEDVVSFYFQQSDGCIFAELPQSKVGFTLSRCQVHGSTLPVEQNEPFFPLKVPDRRAGKSPGFPERADIVILLRRKLKDRPASGGEVGVKFRNHFFHEFQSLMGGGQSHDRFKKYFGVALSVLTF